MKKIIVRSVLSLCLASTLIMTDIATVEAGCEIAQCDYIVRHDKKLGDIQCGKMFYAYWSGIDFFGAKYSSIGKSEYPRKTVKNRL